MKRSLSLSTLLLWSISAMFISAEEKLVDQPLVQKTSETQYQIGKVSLNKETREIRFPAVTHITDSASIIEYLITHSTGEKIHETLLTTEAKPIHINLAFKLLSYRESQALLDPSTKLDPASRFSIHVSHQGQTTPITSWLQHRDTRKPMPLTPWIYNGSTISKKQFMAELNGNIFSVITESSSLANYAGEDRHDDDLWFPASGTPKSGTAVTVIIKPWKH